MRNMAILLLLVLLMAGCSGNENAQVTTPSPDPTQDVTPSVSKNVEIHMTKGPDSLWDMRDKMFMTLENVEVRGIPSEEATVNRNLSYQMVDVYAIVHSSEYSESDLWILIGFFCFDSSYDNTGWVKLEDLVEYRESNMHLLRYPVKVTDDCIDLDTGREVKWDAFAVDYVDDYAVVSREGGKMYKVDKDCIIYPEPQVND